MKICRWCGRRVWIWRTYCQVCAQERPSPPYPYMANLPKEIDNEQPPITITDVLALWAVILTGAVVIALVSMNWYH